MKRILKTSLSDKIIYEIIFFLLIVVVSVGKFIILLKYSLSAILDTYFRILGYLAQFSQNIPEILPKSSPKLGMPSFLAQGWKWAIILWPNPIILLINMTKTITDVDKLTTYLLPTTTSELSFTQLIDHPPYTSSPPTFLHITSTSAIFLHFHKLSFAQHTLPSNSPQ